MVLRGVTVQASCCCICSPEVVPWDQSMEIVEEFVSIWWGTPNNGGWTCSLQRVFVGLPLSPDLSCFCATLHWHWETVHQTFLIQPCHDIIAATLGICTPRKLSAVVERALSCPQVQAPLFESTTRACLHSLPGAFPKPIGPVRIKNHLLQCRMIPNMINHVSI